MAFPLLEFGKLNGFPEGFDDGKIRTTEFLNASSEVIGMLEAFGKLFKPVVSDMKGNVDKLHNHYQKDEKERCFLEDMVLKDQACDDNISRSSLLWLKRALEFIERFFWHILNDETHSNALNSHIKSAYKETLQTYHGYLLQKTFGFLVRWVPSRDTLLGTDEIYVENLTHLKILMPRMRLHLDKLSDFYQEHNLDDHTKV